MSGSPRRRATGFVDRQKAAVESLRRELQREDGTLGHTYFRDLGRWARREAEPISYARLVEACTRARLVFVGDFHADPECAKFAARLMASMIGRVSGLGLGIEFVYTRQQAVLDQRQRGTLNDEAFRRRIHYEEHWGFPWTGYRLLLERARTLGVPVFALDREPRGGASQLAVRDDHAARQIARILTEGRAGRLLVFFGESHVSPGRLPRKTLLQARGMGMDPSSVTVLQDPEGAYWNFLREGARAPAFADLGDGCFATFHTAPLHRYERYREVMERWKGEALGEPDADYTPAVHHLIDILTRWLRVRPERRRVRLAGEWSESLRDCYPEVYSGRDAGDLLGTILREHGRTEEEIDEAERDFTGKGALYEPRSNTFFLARFLPAPASAEAGRFLRVALSGRLFRWPDYEVGDPVDRAYGHAYNEAVALLGARLIDPVSSMDSRHRRDRRPGGPSPASRLEWMERHRAFERSTRQVPPAAVLDPLRGSRGVRRVLARDLGHRLGARLYAGVRSGRIDARALRALFSKRMDPPRVRGWVVHLLRKP